MVQWVGSGNYLAIGDQDCGGYASSCIYPATISGSTATLGSPTSLQDSQGGPVCDMVQGVISPQQNYVAGGDYDYCYGQSTANRWGYPGGGVPTNSAALPSNGYYSFPGPIGAAISNK